MKRLAMVLLLMAALGAGCARDEARPTGIAERWLHAVSDHGRDGLRTDAEHRLREHGDPALLAALVPDDADDDERTFSDLEVGAAAVQGDAARVPFRATARIEGDGRRALSGTVVLARADGDWRVTGIEPRAAGEEVPSEGGRHPANADVTQWIAALLLALALTVASVALIEAQPFSRPATTE